MFQKFVFVLVLLTLVLINRHECSSTNCEQKEKSLAALDLAKESICKAKDLYPTCKDVSETSNSSECGKKDKSLGYIDVALNLISDARDNFPVCPSLPIVKRHPWPMDCLEVLENGHNVNGIHYIWPRNRLFEGKPIQVLCHGGWTVIQYRDNFKKQENFNRGWKDYQIGFGSLSRDFWIGNDNIYALTNQGVYSVRFHMKNANGTYASAFYQNFWIEDENSNYKLHIGNYTEGNAGDSMAFQDGTMFSTKDRDNDNSNSSCAVAFKSGYWFGHCARCNPNGIYQPGKKNNISSLFWGSFKDTDGLNYMAITLKRL